MSSKPSSKPLWCTIRWSEPVSDVSLTATGNNLRGDQRGIWLCSRPCFRACKPELKRTESAAFRFLTFTHPYNHFAKHRASHPKTWALFAFSPLGARPTTPEVFSCGPFVPVDSLPCDEIANLSVSVNETRSLKTERERQNMRLELAGDWRPSDTYMVSPCVSMP